MEISSLFFELLQVSIGESFCLSHTSDNNEWEELYQMTDMQSLIGITFAGIRKLHN